jgi:hypothetical protein
VGVPEIAPTLLNVVPGGNCPDPMDHVYGAVPPVEVNAAVYDDPTVPEGNVKLLMVTTAAQMNVNVLDDCFPVASLTCTVKVYVPASEVVPEIVPVVVVKPMP